MSTLLKKSALTAAAIATISMVSLGASATDANAGGKKFKKFHNHNYSVDFGNDNDDEEGCRPKYKKIWVWSPRKGRKVKRWVRVGEWCGNNYYSY